MSKKTTLIIFSVVGLVVIGSLYFGVSAYKTPGKLDAFAMCLEEKGAMFYGAFWCPHCQNQKAMFGKSAKLLPYTECSTPDGRSQTALCKERGIVSYPTWVFADESRESGEVSLQKLSEKTLCALPQ
ncbi:MAG: hypothetical protein HY455_00250 [Parcubacteria group bacterium]|nr:hypothetical protein [Parcubacteria group bacterium]